MRRMNLKKIDESLQIDSELSTDFKDKNKKRIKSERKTAKRLNVSYQKYLIIKDKEVKLL